MIGAFILSLLMGIIVGLIVGRTIYNSICGSADVLIGWLSGIFIIVIITIVGCQMGLTLGNADIQKDIAGVTALQETYTYSLNDERLSGLEKMEITKEIMEQNIAIARQKVELRQWWNQWLDQELVEEFCSLGPIQ